MKKTMKTLAMAGAMTMAMGMTALAGQWMENGTGWWYDYGNGTWPASSWQWIDGNNDGIAECYYFDQYGYMVANTTTPDGYTVDANGAWVIDGAVQTRGVSGTAVAGNDSESVGNVDMSTPKANLLEMTPDVQDDIEIYDEDFTYGGEDWKGSLRFRAFWADGHESFADYYLGGEYNKLVLKAAPTSNSWWNKTSANIHFYIYDAETGEVLAGKDRIDYDTRKFTLEADVTGVNYIRIRCWGEGANEGGGSVVIKDAYLY